MPIKKDIISVRDVIVMETAASLNVAAILSGTGLLILVLLQAASITKVSSIPIPITKKYIQLKYDVSRIFYVCVSRIIFLACIYKIANYTFNCIFKLYKEKILNLSQHKLSLKMYLYLFLYYKFFFCLFF